MIHTAKRARSMHLAAAVAIVAVALAACGGAATPAPTPTPTAMPTQVPTQAPLETPSVPLVGTATPGGLPTLLTGADRRSLYLFTNDAENSTNCTGPCASAWPPLVVPEGVTPTGGDGVTGTLSTIQRPDGTRQVTYNGIPLYYWSGDMAPGDVMGQGVNGVWFLVAPSATAAGGTITGGIGQPGGGASPSAATGEPEASDPFNY